MTPRHLVFRLSPILAALFLVPSLAHSAICRVSPSGSALADGSTWAAVTTLQGALATPTCTEIWVAQGTYFPTTGTDRTISFLVPAGVAVYGGFAGTETARLQRSTDASLTVLSGNIGDPGTGGDNSYHVVYMDGGTAPITAQTVLDGLTLREGTADHPSAVFHQMGGGLMCYGYGAGSQCSPTLNNLRFRYNYADWGGALIVQAAFNGSGSPTLTDVNFDTNVSFMGGAVLIDAQVGGSSSPSFSRVTFVDNEAQFGGALAVVGSSNGNAQGSLSNVTFNGNRASQQGGALWLDGRDTGIAAVALNHATVTDNSSQDAQGGGAIHTLNGNGGSASTTIRNSIFWGDTAGAGAGSASIEIYNSTPTNASVTVENTVLQGGCPATGNASCSGIITTDPLLLPLANNGGPTQTRLPNAGSPALDAASPGYCLGTDQRGVTRPQGSACDMGATERRGQPHITVTVTGPGQVNAAASPTPINGAISACAESGGSCEASYEGETTPLESVTLTALADPGFTFEAWGGDCASAGQAASVTLPLDLTRACTARFVAQAAVPIQPVPGLHGLALALLSMVLAAATHFQRRSTKK